MRRRRHHLLGNHVTKESGVSVEFTTFGFDHDKEKDMKDIPAGTYVGNRMVYPWVSDDAYDHHLYKL